MAESEANHSLRQLDTFDCVEDGSITAPADPAVVVTSTKSELLDATAALRQRELGTLLFDL